MKVAPIPFDPARHGPAWPDPDPRFLRGDLPPAPPLPLREVLCPEAARWVEDAAEGAGAVPDYVLGALLAVAGSVIGNARWATVWPGWSEPPVLWFALVGAPSANKSPALDRLTGPLGEAEKPLRRAAEAEMKAFEDRADAAKIIHQKWERDAAAAVKKGLPVPAKPDGADPGSAPVLPRLSIADATVERIGVLCAERPRGILQLRDELAGWLMGMERYSGSGSDRPFWLEAYGGRRWTVERMGRASVTVDRLAVGVVGGIQPARLDELLLRSAEDGLLARFVPIYPERVRVRRPTRAADDAAIATALDRLLALDMPPSEDGEPRPWFVPFTDGAATAMDAFREEAQEWETGAEGLLQGFVGKLPGLAARLALVLACLDHAFGTVPPPTRIEAATFGRAAHLVEAYLLPMARRAYAAGSVPEAERKGRRLLAMLGERRMARFTSREVARAGWKGLDTAAALGPVLGALEEGDAIRRMPDDPKPKGGRPIIAYEVNPAIVGGWA